MQNYETIFSKQLNLPSPPIVIQKLQSCIGQDVGNHELAQIIETDQAFTARILRLVNSPFYGFAGKIVSVEEAITMLGLNTIHQLLLTTSLLNTIKIENRALDLNSFWIHSFGVGVIAKRMLYKCAKDIQNEGFMGGILHDIGRLIFVKLDPAKFIDFYTRQNWSIDLALEKSHWEIDHQKLGEILAQKWNFPSSISTVIANHHTPDETTEYSLLVSAVHIADVLCHGLDIGNSGSFYVSYYSPQAWQNLGLSMSELENVLEKSLDEIDNSKHMLGDLH
jgi:HD-like signal output (HDOD) protein